jgi:hypothetical protein
MPLVIFSILYIVQNARKLAYFMYCLASKIAGVMEDGRVLELRVLGQLRYRVAERFSHIAQSFSDLRVLNRK